MTGTVLTTGRTGGADGEDDRLVISDTGERRLYRRESWAAKTLMHKK
jgi:hypothetical protein